MKKKIAIFRTAEKAEAFVETADLGEYDLSWFKPVGPLREPGMSTWRIEMLDQDSSVRSATGQDRERLFATLTAAFEFDPAVRWMYPGAEQHRRYFPEFAAAFAGRAIEHGTEFCMADCEAVSLWLPPDSGPDEALLIQVIEDSVPAEDRETVFALFDEMARHHPSERHRYLPLIGVDPERQGQGLGSELMRHALRICDREGLPAYLESTNPRNIPLYRRHGFEISGTIRAGSSPPIVAMLRRPKR